MYSSIHYVFETRSVTKFTVEVQVRTSPLVFEFLQSQSVNSQPFLAHSRSATSRLCGSKQFSLTRTLRTLLPIELESVRRRRRSLSDRPSCLRECIPSDRGSKA